MYSLWVIALLAPCVFANPLFLNETRAIPAGSCGVNKYGTREIDPYIVGGKDTRANAYPWQVAIFYNGQFSCGGSIISDQYILTAGHCVEDTYAQYFTIYAGKHAINSQEASQRTFRVASFKRHEYYNPTTISNDVAVMKLSTRIVFDDNIQPICLPSASIGTLEGQTPIVTGWGDLYEGGSMPTYLQEVPVPVISNAICKQVMPGTTVDAGMLCGGFKTGGVGHCFGDSGGPYQVKVGGKWTQVGIVSWAMGCGGANQPDVYTRVSYFVNWIKTNTP